MNTRFLDDASKWCYSNCNRGEVLTAEVWVIYFKHVLAIFLLKFGLKINHERSEQNKRENN